MQKGGQLLPDGTLADSFGSANPPSASDSRPIYRSVRVVSLSRPSFWAPFCVRVVLVEERSNSRSDLVGLVDGKGVADSG